MLLSLVAMSPWSRGRGTGGTHSRQLQRALLARGGPEVREAPVGRKKAPGEEKHAGG